MNTTDASALAENLLQGIAPPGPVRLDSRTTGRSGAHSWLVVAGDRRFMLKVGAAGMQGRWATSVAIQKRAAEQKITPPLVSTDPRARAVLSHCVPDASLLGALFDPERTEDVLGSLVDQISALHRIDPTPFEPGEGPLEYCRTIADRLPFVLPSFAIEPWKDLQDRDPSPVADTLCHLDLNPSNLVFDGTRVWIVDWDTAGPGDRWLDLATVVNMLLLSPERTRWVLERYAEVSGVRPTPETFADARRLVYVAYGFAFLDLVRHPPDVLPLGETSLSLCYRALQEGRISMDTDVGRYQLAQAYFAGYSEVM